MFAFIKGLTPPEGLPERQLRLSSLAAQDCHLITNSAPEVSNDSYLYQDEVTLACFDGCLANSKSLIDSYAVQGIDELLEKVLVDQDTSLPHYFYGQFTCMSYRAEGQGKGIFFGNQVGSAKLYYWHQGQQLIVSGSLAMVVAILRHNNVKCELDEIGVRMLMAHGYLYADYTTIAGIKHLEAGSILRWDGGELRETKYCRYPTEISSDGMHKAVHILNDLFRESVQHIHEWDLRHQRRHLAFLSGGLDSRMTVYTAKDLGFKDLSVLNFSQTGYKDHTIARKIARKEGLNFLFYPLDGGRYLLDSHTAINYNDGQVFYQGATHLDAALRAINQVEFGIIMSGQIGELMLGRFLNKPEHEPAGAKSISINPVHDPALDDVMKRVEAAYPNHEHFSMYNRCFNSASNGDWACFQKGHSISPFTYTPFMIYSFSLDPKIRYNNQLYFKWFNTYQKRAARIPWEKTWLPPSLGLKAMELGMLAHKVRDRLNMMGLTLPQNMNPYARWFKADPALLKSLDEMIRNSDTHGVMAASNLAVLFNENINSPLFNVRMSAYTAAHSLNKMLGGDQPWIPERFTGGF